MFCLSNSNIDNYLPDLDINHLSNIKDFNLGTISIAINIFFLKLCGSVICDLADGQATTHPLSVSLTSLP